MAAPNDPDSSERSQHLPKIGFDLFPSKPPSSATSPAPHAAAVAAPTLPPKPGTRKPPTQPVTHYRSRPQRTSFWRLDSPLFAVAIFLLGWTIFNAKIVWQGGLAHLTVAQIGLAIYLLYRAVVALIVCFVGLKVMGEDIGPIPSFLLQVLAATTFAASLGYAVPHVGIWICEPLAMCLLFAWLFEVRFSVGTLLSAITWIVTWGTFLLLFVRLGNSFP